MGSQITEVNKSQDKDGVISGQVQIVTPSEEQVDIRQLSNVQNTVEKALNANNPPIKRDKEENGESMPVEAN